MMVLQPPEPECSQFVEVDPTGRYGRYDEILGKGASKTVYRAFDEFEGIEVAWNQVKLYDFLQSPEDLERLYCEIHLLKTLKHKNIMKFYTSWVDIANRNINFVTEMFTSGTLRQYRQKHRRVNIRAVKHWCRQILRGLLYLHSHDPPVIHRDLKCDNIFVNGNQGVVKIGDLGLAAILRKSHAAHCVGTPEFMAPEVYEEEYNELVDIYSFGMCLLEMVTFEYPYSECTHPAQIYKKVISGKQPEALFRVQDPEVRQFVEKCLAPVSRRLPARELLKDPFLQIDDCGSDLRLVESRICPTEIAPFLTKPLLKQHHGSCIFVNGVYNNSLPHESDYELDWNVINVEPTDTAVFSGHEDESCTNADISIKGKRRDDKGIFLRLRIADREGRVRNIYFPFDIEADTALSVATEMVAELDITDQDVTKIAEMIDGEISTLVPDWKLGPRIEETVGFHTQSLCHHCDSNGSSNGSLLDYLSANNLVTPDQQVVRCSRSWCAAMHGRFEEITYQVEGSDHCCMAMVSSQSDGLRYTDIWGQHEGHDKLSSQGSRETHSDEEHNQSDRLILAKDMASIRKSHHSNHHQPLGISNSGYCPPTNFSSPNYATPDDYENEIRRELRWLKAKYQTELRELSKQQFGTDNRPLIPLPIFNQTRHEIKDRTMDSLSSRPLQTDYNLLFIKSYASTAYPSSSPDRICVPSKASNCFDGSYYPDLETQRALNCGVNCEYSPEHINTAKSFYAGALLPHSLHRSRSLPVDPIDV